MQLSTLLGFVGFASLTVAVHLPTPTPVTPISPPPPGQSKYLSVTPFLSHSSVSYYHSAPDSSTDKRTAYEVGYPLCGIPGFTVVPGLYNETVEQESGSTLKCCHDECRKAYPACKSFAYHARYTECLFFDDVVENTQLTKDDTSEFVHYDLKCHV
jgi:hypothetical protein